MSSKRVSCLQYLHVLEIVLINESTVYFLILSLKEKKIKINAPFHLFSMNLGIGANNYALNISLCKFV